jgi:positive regulator of sigma E activity
MGNFNPNRLKVGQRVTIGIPENLLVAGALSAYLVPLVFALAGAMLGSYAGNFMERDVVSVIGGFIGLIAGGWLVRLGQKRVGIDKFKTPVLVNLLDT